MMKKVSMVLAVLLSLTAALTGCNPAPSVPEQNIEIWSTYNTQKVMRDREYDGERQNAAIDILMALGETEGGQIIVTPTADVSSYEVTVTDLLCGSERIAAKDIEILVQKYIPVEKATQSSTDKHEFPLGYYPDALVPIAAIRKKNEDKIKGGENQGFYYKVTTDAERTKAGVYTGTSEIRLDEKTFSVPVTVTVADIDISETHSKSNFMIKKEFLMQGELDNSDEMYQTYFDFIADFRLTPTDVNFDYEDEEAYANRLVELYDNEKLGCLSLTSKQVYRLESSISPNEGLQYLMDFDYAALEKRLLAIAAKANETGKNLFEDMHLYLLNADEPQYTNRIGVAKYLNVRVKECLEKVADQVGESTVFSRVDITEMPLIVTTPTLDYENYDETIDTFCPETDFFKYQSDRYEYKQLENNGEDSTWWYTAWVPFYPMPSYHIDTDLLGARVLSWMQYEYGIEGNLYWSTSAYGSVENSVDCRPRDPYNDPIAFAGATANGDGYLTYPGRPYGLDTPVSSLRLETIRDGIEDYELMYRLEQLLTEYNETYKTNFTAREYLSTLYADMFYGITASFDQEAFHSARRELIDSILLLTGNLEGTAVVKEINYETNKATVQVHGGNGVTIKVDGKAVADEFVFDFSRKNRVEIEFTDGKETFVLSKYISEPYTKTTTYAEDITGWRASKGVDNETEHIVLSREDGRFVITQTAYLAPEGKSYDPRLVINTSDLFGGKALQNISEIRFYLECSAETEIEIIALNTTGNVEYLVDRYHLFEGENEIRLGNLSKQKFMKDKGCDMFLIKLSRLTEGSIVYKMTDCTVQETR